MGMTIIIALVTFVVGGLLVWFVMRVLMKSRYDAVIREAEKESEVMKQKKLLEVKEKFLHLKADLEKQVSARNSKIQSVEAKLKQRELNLNQRQEDLQRKNSEVDAVKENLAAQLELVDKKKQDLEKLHQREIEHLETLSGLSAEEAKERLIESLKDEAKSEATSYINEIMEEAKMTANKEAKKIVIQSIQRVATETAIENSITVFHIESDEVWLPKRQSRIRLQSSISNQTRSKAVSSVVKGVTFGRWKQQPVLRSWLTIRLKQSCCPVLIRSVVK